MPTPEELEVADLFLSKATSDLAAVRALAHDPDQGDDVIGFHAQQAVEKALKGVVAAYGLEIPRSHDLVLLVRLLELAGVALPDVVGDAGWLNPWAVSMRYDEVESPLDRRRAVEVGDEALSWATQAVAGRRR